VPQLPLQRKRLGDLLARQDLRDLRVALDGTYRICAQAPSTAWLANCEWGATPVTTTLSNTQISTNVPISLKTGAVVSIRVDDPSQLLPRYEGNTPGAHLLLGVKNAALAFRQATVVSQDSAGRNDQVVVPFGSTVNVHAFSSFFKLANMSGTALSNNAFFMPVLVPAGHQPATLEFQVVGGGK
jgi:hypothetical protein